MCACVCVCVNVYGWTRVCSISGPQCEEMHVRVVHVHVINHRDL